MKNITQFNKAYIGGIVAAIVPWLLVDLLQLQIPGEVMMAINGLVVAVVVWAVPNIQKAVDNIGGE